MQSPNISIVKFKQTASFVSKIQNATLAKPSKSIQIQLIVQLIGNAMDVYSMKHNTNMFQKILFEMCKSKEQI